VKISFLTVVNFLPHGIEMKSLKKLKVENFIPKPFKNKELLAVVEKAFS